MKILYVLENYHPHIGGVEHLFKTLAERMAKKHEVTVCTRRLPKTKKEEVINDVRIVRVPSLDDRYLFTFSSIPTVIRLAREADVIHTTTYNAMLPSSLASWITDTPAVCTVHESWIGRWRKHSDFSPFVADLHDLAERILYLITSFNKYVCVSKSTKSMLNDAVGKTKGRTIVIHSGFSPGFWKRKRKTDKMRRDLGLEGKFVIFAAGRPGTSKGFKYLLDAFLRVRERVSEAELVMVLAGGSQYEHRIREWRERYPDVKFMDQQSRENLAALRQMADCIVVPSLAEGFGYAVLESVASGTPLVTTRTTSIPEVIGGRHVLIRPKSVKALVDGIVRVHDGDIEKRPVKKFPWSETIRKQERLYKEVA